MEEFNFFGASNGASPFDSLNGDSQSFPSSPQSDAPFAEAKGVGKSQEPEPRSATTESVPASLFGNPPVILSQDSDPFNSGAFGGSPMEKHGFPHQNHFTQLNGHVTTSNDAAPGSASKTQSSSTAETQPAATHNDKTDDLPDLFGAQASEFDSFLQPPASGNMIFATKSFNSYLYYAFQSSSISNPVHRQWLGQPTRSSWSVTSYAASFSGCVVLCIPQCFGNIHPETAHPTLWNRAGLF